MLGTAVPQRDIQPPYGGAIARVTAMPTHFPSWRDAVRIVGPKTRPTNRIFDAEDAYPIHSEGIEHVSNYVLMWAGSKVVTTTNEAKAWGRDQGLNETHPYEGFSLSIIFPFLYTKFRLLGAGLMATQSGMFFGALQNCGVWQAKGDENWASIFPVEQVCYDRTIFVFRE